METHGPVMALKSPDLILFDFRLWGYLKTNYISSGMLMSICCKGQLPIILFYSTKKSDLLETYARRCTIDYFDSYMSMSKKRTTILQV